MDVNTISIDGRLVPIGDERNLLEVIRRAGIDIPTFCYHSDLSVYGACRLCIVDIQGRGIVTSCTVTPEPGMIVKTNTAEIRQIRKVAVELLLASHDVSCPTCSRSASCQLLNLANRFGIKNIRYRRRHEPLPLDMSSDALVHDPNKCVLCGDCVRMCSEVQGIGAIDFAHRGSQVQVMPAFGHGLGHVECVNCGQCSSVCPTGALTPKSEIDDVWKAIHDTSKVVVAQVAPAVRVGIGEAFGLPAGQTHMGQIAAALRAMGVDRVYDTAFAADLTVLEEGSEFLKRFESGEKLPQFTSCCPAWVKLVEQRYPDMLENLSTCRSPQQMFGSVAKQMLSKELSLKPENIFVVSVMPCTAKKFEAKRGEFSKDGLRDVDAVITTVELAQMIREAGLDFKVLEPERLDSPFGFKSGAGIIFGTTGGVSEAVLRFAGEVLGKKHVDHVQFKKVRGLSDIREAEIRIGDETLRLGIAHGLAAAQRLVDDVREGKRQYDLIEVMACPGGCIGGAGQPASRGQEVRKARQEGLYQVDTMLQMHNSQDNPYVQRLYADTLGEPGGDESHKMLHTHYHARRRADGPLVELPAQGDSHARIEVCVGTNCHLRGSHDLLHKLIDYVDAEGLTQKIDIVATFCNEACDRGPTCRIGGDTLYRCSFEQLKSKVHEFLEASLNQ